MKSINKLRRELKKHVTVPVTIRERANGNFYIKESWSHPDTIRTLINIVGVSIQDVEIVDTSIHTKEKCLRIEIKYNK